MADEVLAQANELLSAHALAAVRLCAWHPLERQAWFEIFHIEWPAQVFGQLRFSEVSYLQCPTSTSWGYRLRTLAAASALLPSRGDRDPADIVYEMFTPDGAEPSAFVVAESLHCIAKEAAGP